MRIEGQETVVISTVGDAFRFVTSPGPVEWLEYYGLHKAARAALHEAADNGMRTRHATDAVRRQLFRAQLS